MTTRQKHRCHPVASITTSNSTPTIPSPPLPHSPTPLLIPCALFLVLLVPGSAAAQAVNPNKAEANFSAIMRAQNSQAHALRGARPGDVPGTGDASVELPLSEFSRLWQRVMEHRRKVQRRPGPAVLLTESSYSGKAVRGTLFLKARLRVILGRPGQWKVVPLVGTSVVLTRAVVDGKPVDISTRPGYQVWVTRRTGEVTVELSLVVPPRGPRGSIEYDFVVARTPVTSFSCTFPTAGLEPRMDAAVTTAVRAEGGATVLQASLRPTNRVHLLGFRDLGEDATAQRARIFAETLNLLSVDEGALELFSVIRYTILYAGTKSFEVLIPPHTTVVSANGKGAFRYTLEKRGGATLLRGETAFPIRNTYEISLRLRRKIKKAGQTFLAPLPRCRRVERETGWLAVEVPGKLRLSEQKRTQMLAVDVRHLPSEIVRSSVSPILKAYRYHAPGRRLKLSTRLLPEHRTAPESIDRVRVFSVVSRDGGVLTEFRVTMRNRLRRSLRLDVPKGVSVRSVLLDGRPVSPSRDSRGFLVLPLKRSAGTDSLTAITLQVILEHGISALGWAGAPKIALPALSLPISSLSWTVYLPQNNLYGELKGPIATQLYWGSVQWRRPEGQQSASSPPDSSAWASATPADARNTGETGSAESGATPVRIKLPRTGERLEYVRYWIEKAQPVTVSFSYIKRGLLYPVVFLLGTMLIFGLTLAAGRRPGLARTRRWASVALALAAGVALVRLGATTSLLICGALAAALIIHRRQWWSPICRTARQWTSTLHRRFRLRRRLAGQSRSRRIWRVLLATSLVVTLLMVLTRVARLVIQLGYPLEG